MAVQVNVFNLSTQQVAVSVNGGAPCQIAATGTSANWVPQQPASGPTFAGSGPTPGAFGYGTNQVTVSFGYSPMPSVIFCAIPNYMPIQSLQIFLWTTNGQDAGWMAMSSGVMFASGQSHASSMAKNAAE